MIQLQSRATVTDILVNNNWYNVCGKVLNTIWRGREEHIDSLWSSGAIWRFFITSPNNGFSSIWHQPSHVPDSKVHGASMGPTWVLSAPCWPHEPCYQGMHKSTVTWREPSPSEEISSAWLHCLFRKIILQFVDFLSPECQWVNNKYCFHNLVWVPYNDSKYSVCCGCDQVLLLVQYQLNEAERRIYASPNLPIIGSDNGLSPGRRPAIIWTNAAILSIRP